MTQTTDVTEVNSRGVIPHIIQLMGIWPTVWLWIRLVHASIDHFPKGTRSEAMFEKKQRRHNAAIHALVFLLGFHLERRAIFNELTTLVEKTDGVLQIVG